MDDTGGAVRSIGARRVRGGLNGRAARPRNARSTGRGVTRLALSAHQRTHRRYRLDGKPDGPVFPAVVHESEAMNCPRDGLWHTIGHTSNQTVASRRVLRACEALAPMTATDSSTPGTYARAAKRTRLLITPPGVPTTTARIRSK